MKNRITVEQLNTLTDEQQNNLKELWKPQEGDFVVFKTDSQIVIRINGDLLDTKNPGHLPPLRESCWHRSWLLPLLDISQMVEILKEKECLAVYMLTVTQDNLCDELWELVKGVL
jgi:hypothetical protein